MKKILIFGGNGMLGSEIALYLSEKKKYKIFVTVRELKLIKNY